MSDDIFSALLRFHREVAMPDVREAVRAEVRNEVSSLRDEMLSHFDALYRRFERLESEYEALQLQRRIEELESSAS